MVYSASFDITLDPGDTGLTLKAQIFDVAGSQVGGDITTGFVEAGGGMYTSSLTAIPDAHRGSVRFLDGATLKAHTAINPEELENVDLKLGTATFPELSQAQPPTTPTLRQLLMLLYMALRNKETSSTNTLSIRNNAGTVITKAPTSDDGSTFTRDKLVTGP